MDCREFWCVCSASSLLVQRWSATSSTGKCSPVCTHGPLADRPEGGPGYLRHALRSKAQFQVALQREGKDVISSSDFELCVKYGLFPLVVRDDGLGYSGIHNEEHRRNATSSIRKAHQAGPASSSTILALIISALSIMPFEVIVEELLEKWNKRKQCSGWTLCERSLTRRGDEFRSQDPTHRALLYSRVSTTCPSVSTKFASSIGP
nr:hypothetical protein CFP56_62929 [Quercus suber]